MPPKTELGISDLFKKGINLFKMLVRSNAPNSMAMITTNAHVPNADESILILPRFSAVQIPQAVEDVHVFDRAKTLTSFHLQNFIFAVKIEFLLPDHR